MAQIPDQPDGSVPTLLACSRHSVAIVPVPNGVLTTILTVTGTGKMLQAAVEIPTAVAPTEDAGVPVQYCIRIFCDGVYATDFCNRQATQSMVATSGRCSIGEFFQGAGATWLFFRLPVEFRREIALAVFQTSGVAEDVTGWLETNLIR